jgi:hypothetical protein
MPEILKRTSFGLLRTNPKLSTNIKIVADSRNKIYLETIDADPLLSKSIYKGYEVSSNGSYSFDLKRFYSQSGNQIPKNIAYMLFEEDASLEIKDRYKNQFDFTYGYGMYPKNSRIYPEEFAIFAPLWIETDNIPEYFVIFKMDGPVTVNINDPSVVSLAGGSTANFDTASILNDLVINPSRFMDNYVRKAKIIKSFDLTDKTSIGKYIRNHVNDPRFPESPLYTNFQKGNLSNWQGVSYTSGGFCKIPQDIYKDYVLVDKTVTENDDFITNGFYRYGVVCANLLNLEFLFDDPEQTDYQFSRYFGLYMSAVELGKFFLDQNRLYADKDIESTQIPRPISPTIGSPTNTIDQIQSNEKGIKIYPNVNFESGSTSPYSGRLLNFSEIQNPRFGYVKDRDGNLYSIDQNQNWESTYAIAATGSSGPSFIVDTDYLRIKNNTVNWKTFTGFDVPFQYIPSYTTDKRGRPIAAFEVTGTITPGDEIRIKYVDWNSPGASGMIDFFTLDGLNSIPAGNANGLSFSILGTKEKIAESISKAINNIQSYTGEYQIFSSISKGSSVYIFCRTDSENWNKLKYSLFSNSPTFPFKPFNQYKQATQQLYQPSPISISTVQFGWFFEDNFAGGNNNPSSRIVVEKTYINEFRSDDDLIYIKTERGFDTTSAYGLYTDEPIFNTNGDIVDFKNIDKYFVVNLSNTQESVDFGSSRKIGLYKYAKNSNGYLSIFPIRDFDFDFHSTEYNKSADSSIDKLYGWYSDTSVWTDTQPIFDPSLLSPSGITIIDSTFGPSSSFVINGEFQRLTGLSNELLDTETSVSNEYDRLKENDIPELALSSRVVPFINKWVYDNESVDVRENPYRMNTDQTFGYTNFSPSFEEFGSNPKLFTEEWTYLQKYPPYMSFDEKVNSYSYFDYDLYFPDLPTIGVTGSTTIYAGLTGGTGASANLLSIVEDYFKSYFTRETVGGSAINRDFKYSIFAYGDDVRFSETLFRGVKTTIKDRSEFSPINYNIESLRFLPNSKYNGYKFSAVLTYSSSGTNYTFIKNDKWKTLTLVIQADLKDVFLQYYDRDPISGATGATHSFIDRSSLYTLTSKYKLNPGGTGFAYDDTNITGAIGGSIFYWEDIPGVGFRVYGGEDQFGSFTNFSEELTLNVNGTYNNLNVINPGNPNYNFTFSQISQVNSGSFVCQQITGPGFSPGPTGTIVGGAGINSCSVDGFSIPPVWNPSSFSTYVSTFNYNPIYVGGGYNAYSRILEEISFASIAKAINQGDPNVNYFQVSEIGEVTENRYVVELVLPDYPFKASYLKSEALKKKPVDLQNSADVIGYEITADDSLTLNQLARNRGGYSPKFKDVFKFIDTDDIKNEDLQYRNIQMLTDIGYLQDYQISTLNNVYFNKVNIENPNVILRYSASEARSIYPLIGEIAIDYSNFFGFRSNWDPFYYWKYSRRDTRSTVMGTREPKEEKSFFGSKVVAIPNQIRLETFPGGDDTVENKLPNKNSFINTGKSIASLKITESRKETLNLRVFTTLALQTFLIGDGFGNEFNKYINPEYSFGNPDLDDDVKLYIQENIFDRYIIKEIIFWEKFWERGNSLPQVQFGLTDIQKIQAGYTKSKNFSINPLFVGSLDFDLIYTLPNDRNSSIAFTVVLEKK